MLDRSSLIIYDCLAETAKFFIRATLAAKQKDEFLPNEIIRATGLNSNELLIILVFCFEELKKESSQEQIQSYLYARYEDILDEHLKFLENYITTEDKD